MIVSLARRGEGEDNTTNDSVLLDIKWTRIKIELDPKEPKLSVREDVCPADSLKEGSVKSERLLKGEAYKRICHKLCYDRSDSDSWRSQVEQSIETRADCC